MIETSADVTELAKALAKFQGKIGAVGKDSTAKVEKDGRLLYSYKYADLASVLEATREERAAAGLSVVQFPTGGADGIKLVTTLLHTSGQWMRGDLTLRPMDAKPQTIGSLITYLRRYSYSAALGIATEEDDDGAAAQGNGKPPVAGGAAKANTVKATPTALMANASQIQQIHIMKEKIGGWTGTANHPGHPYRQGLAAYKNAGGVACLSSKELTYEQAANFIKRMQGLIDRQADTARAMEAQNPLGRPLPGDIIVAGATREPGSDDDMELPTDGSANDNGEPADPGQLADVRAAAEKRWGKKVKDLAPQWLQKEFGVTSTADLSTAQAARALQMLLSGNIL